MKSFLFRNNVCVIVYAITQIKEKIFLAQISILLVFKKCICSKEPFSPGQFIAHFYMFMVYWTLNEIIDINIMRVSAYLEEIILSEFALSSHMEIWQVWRLLFEDLSHGDRARRIMEGSVRKRSSSRKYPYHTIPYHIHTRWYIPSG